MTTDLALARVRAAFVDPFASLCVPGGEAAVLIGLREPTGELVLTRRATHLNSHAGEVAFPGGKLDPQDASLATTVLRETHEEIGIPPAAVELIGMMPSQQSRFGVNVIPFVGVIDPHAVLTPNPAELDLVFQVPLQFFLETSPQLAHQVKYRHQHYLMPCFQWRDHVIWGLTARFIVDFVAKVYDAPIDWPAPALIK